ncbi:MAG TPA: cytochrome c peroxidase [Gemmatimonadales bacterium]|jgi:cytochrome c peroxidase
MSGGWRGTRVPHALALLIVLAGCQATAPPEPADPRSVLGPLLSRADARPLDPLASGSPPLIRLGQALFFDKILSGNRDIGCSTCHNPVYHTSDFLMLSIGTGGHRPGGSRELGTGAFTSREATDLFDRGQPGWRVLMWDGRVASTASGLTTPFGAALPPGLSGPLAAQALLPLVARVEMRGRGSDELATIPDSAPHAVFDAILARLRTIPGYDTLFAAAYPGTSPGSITIAQMANAIAAFIADRWSTGETAFDRYLRGDTAALNDQALRGAVLFFGRARCSECHRGPLLSDQDFHNTGIPVLGPGLPDVSADVGRAAVTGLPDDRFRFRTPPLRNVDLTAPYMHNGSYRTLEDVIRHYRDPGESLARFDPTPLDPRLIPTLRIDPATVAEVLATLDPRLRVGIRLSDQDVLDLAAFLRALTDPASGILLDDVPDNVPSGLPVLDH